MNYEHFPDQEENDLEHRVLAVLREFDPGAQGSLDDYITTFYTDENNLSAEIRVRADDEGGLKLNANIGKPLALLSLKAFLEKHGLRVVQLVAIQATPSERAALTEATKRING